MLLAVHLKPLLGRVVCPREIWGLTEDHTVVLHVKHEQGQNVCREKKLNAGMAE